MRLKTGKSNAYNLSNFKFCNKELVKKNFEEFSKQVVRGFLPIVNNFEEDIIQHEVNLKKYFEVKDSFLRKEKFVNEEKKDTDYYYPTIHDILLI